jgi:uncharacterized delta-60 repeat protein
MKMHLHVLRFALVSVGLLLALQACGGPPVTPPVTAIIGAAGGTLSTSSGAKVVIPPGALVGDITIGIEQTSAGSPALPTGFATVGQMFAFTPHGQTFAVPVTITLPFNPALVPAGGTPQLYKNNAQNQWEPVVGAAFGPGSVSGSVTGFSFPVVVVPSSFTVGGTVTGLTGSGLILEDRANALDLTPTGNGTFTFRVPFTAPRAYDVRVKAQPLNPLQTCSVTNGTGTISNANITNIAVNCVIPALNGALDSSFGDGGKTFTPFGGDETALALQADGKLVMVGGSVNDFSLARYGADGRLDLGFGSAGLVTTDIATAADQARGVAIQSDGKIVVVGSAVVGRTANNNFNFDFALARYNTDGTLDNSFSGDGKVTTDFNLLTDIAHAVTVQSDGKIIVVGFAKFSEVAGGDFALARYNSDGTLDTGFSGDGKVTTDFDGGPDIARNVVMQANQTILVSGFGEVNSRDGTGLARYDSSGALDNSFGSAGKATVTGKRLEEGLALQSDGKIVIAGSVLVGVFPSASSQFAAMRLGANGSPDNGFGTAGLVTLPFTTLNDFGFAIALQADNKIVVAGQSSNGANPDFAVARFNTNGTPDGSFGTGGKLTTSFFDAGDKAESVVIQPDGKIVLGGFAFSGTQIGYGLARVNP